MNILIISPSLNIHGGIRVLVEWANHLHKRGHSVTLQIESGPIVPPNNWIDIDTGVSVMPGAFWKPNGFDIAVAGTPNIANRLDSATTTAKKFFLLQMAEDLFAPGTRGYVQQCLQSYRVRMPIIGISKWVEEYVRQKGRGEGVMHYIGNGVSDHFQPGKKDEQLTVLAEGWHGYNPAKDTYQLTAKVAKHLKQKYNASILAYSQFRCQHHSDVPDEYYTSPGTEQIKMLYQRAHFMVKATRYDARSCAPVEAMACGTPTVRALVKGDDDLIDGFNCIRGGYDLESLIFNAEKMAEDTGLRDKLASNGLAYRKQNLSWDYWMREVEKIFNES